MSDITNPVRKYSAAYCEYPSRILAYSHIFTEYPCAYPAYSPRILAYLLAYLLRILRILAYLPRILRTRVFVAYSLAVSSFFVKFKKNKL